MNDGEIFGRYPWAGLLARSGIRSRKQRALHSGLLLAVAQACRLEMAPVFGQLAGYDGRYWL